MLENSSEKNDEIAVDKEYQNLMDSLSNLLVENRGNWLEKVTAFNILVPDCL